MLCSNHGKYGGGLCHCEEGWKGTECDVPETDCKVADCSGHGECKNGMCQCHQGWKGDDCNEGTVFMEKLFQKVFHKNCGWSGSKKGEKVHWGNQGNAPGLDHPLNIY